MIVGSVIVVRGVVGVAWCVAGGAVWWVVGRGGGGARDEGGDVV